MRTMLSAALSLILLILAVELHAQEIPEFNKMRTPTSPAFIVLGITPVQVERPTTPAPFAASFLQRVGQELRLLPNSYALETTPYWWYPHPTLTFDDYQNRRWEQSILQDFTFSLAVTDSAPVGRSRPDTTYRRLGVGFRTTLAPGRSIPTPPCVAAIDTAAAAVASGIGRRAARAIAADPTLAADEARLNLLMLEWEREVRSDSIIAAANVPECTRQISARRGFVMDGASAFAVHFPNGRAESGAIGAFAVWLTPAFLGEQWSATLVGRARWDDFDTDTTAMALDVGGRGTYAHDRWAISGETVFRRLDRAGSPDNLVRLSGSLDLQLTGETWLTATFGRDFNANEPQSFLAVLNFQWNVGDRSVTPNPVQ